MHSLQKEDLAPFAVAPLAETGAGTVCGTKKKPENFFSGFGSKADCVGFAILVLRITQHCYRKGRRSLRRLRTLACKAPFVLLLFELVAEQVAES